MWASARGHEEVVRLLLGAGSSSFIWEFPKIRGPYLGVLIIRILLFRVLY